jgi:phage gpG-like protein
VIATIEITQNGHYEIKTDLTQAMKKVKDVMRGSVDLNFAEGGRPKWELRKTSPTRFYNEHPLLRRTGNLLGSIKGRSDTNSATVGTNKVYAWAMDQGARLNIPITNRSRRFFWMMWFRTNDSIWKYMAISKSGVFKAIVPPRQFMMFQNEDIEKILDIIGKGIIQFTQGQTTHTVENV